MDAKCPCQNCNTNLEFDAKAAGQSVACPNCGVETTLVVPPMPSTRDITRNPKEYGAGGIYRSPVSPPTQRAQQMQNPNAEQILAKKRLDFVRANSCYGVLRSIVKIAAGISIVISILWACGLIAEFAAPASSSDNPGMMIIVVFGACAGAALSIFLIIGLRQAAFLMIDIADTLLHRHAANKD